MRTWKVINPGKANWVGKPTGYRGRNMVRQITAKGRSARAVPAVSDWCRRNRHRSIRAQHHHHSTMETYSPVHPFTHPDSPSGRRGRFIRHQLWVTPYDSAERFPVGEFVNQSDGSDGIETWMKADRSIENTDIVLWHSFGLHHLPRPEDRPVQPRISCGFTLMPAGFFGQNPVIDLPPNITRQLLRLAVPARSPPRSETGSGTKWLRTG